MSCVFGETIRSMYGCSCYFVVECYGGVESGWRCSVAYTVYGLPKNVCVVPLSKVISSFRSLRTHMCLLSSFCFFA